MYNIAYDKDTHQILGYINTNKEINPEEVFSDLTNYLIKKTDDEPPFVGFNNYKIGEEGESVSYRLIEQVLSEAEQIKNSIEELKTQLRETNDIAFEFLEGELSVLEFAEIKLQRKNIRNQIRQLQERLRRL